MNRKDIIRHPCHVGLILLHEPFEFVGNGTRISATMRLAEHLMTTPAAVVGTATRGDERHRSLAVVFPPSLDVSRKIDRLPIRPRLRIEVANLLPRLGPHDRSIGVAEHNSVYVAESVQATQPTRWNQLLQRQFSFAG